MWYMYIYCSKSISNLPVEEEDESEPLGRLDRAPMKKVMLLRHGDECNLVHLLRSVLNIVELLCDTVLLC